MGSREDKLDFVIPQIGVVIRIAKESCNLWKHEELGLIDINLKQIECTTIA